MVNYTKEVENGFQITSPVFRRSNRIKRDNKYRSASIKFNDEIQPNFQTDLSNSSSNLNSNRNLCEVLSDEDPVTSDEEYVPREKVRDMRGIFNAFEDALDSFKDVKDSMDFISPKPISGKHVHNSKKMLKRIFSQYDSANYGVNLKNHREKLGNGLPLKKNVYPAQHDLACK